MFPVARGAYGQPPSPAHDASKSVAPAASAATAFAYPVLRVLCRCTPGARVRSTSAPTCRGVATPIVSARTISALSNSAASSVTTPGSTLPSNGQPNATLIVIVTGSTERPITSAAAARASAIDWLALRRLNDSLAASVKLTRSRPVATSRSYPFTFSARPEYSVPSRRSIAPTTSSAPAICGTASGRTKLAASIRGSRAALRRLTSSARPSGGSVSGSFCRPSRGPTSQTVTRML